MSSGEESKSSHAPGDEVPAQDTIGQADQDTLRIMLSTDNHLGYSERDPVRGLDSFAAFEEVLALARDKECDMVLIAGDLFHDNKPSRRTLHKTMEIIRKYCMGPNPVQVKIVSDQASNFRSVNGTVNYEDQFYSVDLPIFSIHGNHDDPTRSDGGNEMLAALDLLAVSNLVNYFGRQDEVDKVEISPVLMQKGSTKVAMYGMGSMRDERLNRMWQGKKVRFLRPDLNDQDNDEDDEEETPWFNIFALHQNRDLGRGAKNCVHESMIPEWMDLVVWGHEHECRIDPQESVVGTFRITQPGSSVATSLTAGEAVQKNVGILDIRGNQFRLLPIPLTQVRSFVIGELSLSDHRHHLDIEDPKIDTKVSTLLQEEVDLLVYQAKDKIAELQQAAKASGNNLGEKRNSHLLQYRLQKPKEVLVRLKVEHSGYSTLNNQRFGAKFVGKVANPSDVLLFHRKRQESEKSGSSKKKKASSGLNQPMAPAELEEMDIEDLAKQELENADKKLEILNEQRLGLALDDFVSKEQKLAISDATADMLKKQQKKLIKRGSDADTASAVQEPEPTRDMDAAAEEEQNEEERPRKRAVATQRNKKRATERREEEEDKENLSDDDMETERVRKRRARATSTRKKTTTSRASRSPDVDSDGDFDDPAPAPSRARPRRRAAKSQTNYTYGSDSDKGDEESDAVVDLQDDDDDELDDLEDEEEEVAKPKKRGRAASSSTSSSRKRKAGRSTQSQLSFASTNKRGGRTASNRRRPVTNYADDGDDDSDDNVGASQVANSLGLSGGWGTAPTPSMK